VRVGLFTGFFSPALVPVLLDRSNPLWRLPLLCGEPLVHRPLAVPRGYCLIPSVHYHVDEVRTTSDGFALLVQTLTAFVWARPSQTAMVFCLTWKQVQAVRDHLAQLALTGRLANLKESEIIAVNSKNNELSRYLEQDQTAPTLKVCVTTTAAAVGVTASSCFLVMLFGGSFGVSTMAQLLQRARRVKYIPPQSPPPAGFFHCVRVSDLLRDSHVGEVQSASRVCHEHQALAFVGLDSVHESLMMRFYSQSSIETWAGSPGCLRTQLARLGECDTIEDIDSLQSLPGETDCGMCSHCLPGTDMCAVIAGDPDSISAPSLRIDDQLMPIAASDGGGGPPSQPAPAFPPPTPAAVATSAPAPSAGGAPQSPSAPVSQPGSGMSPCLPVPSVASHTSVDQQVTILTQQSQANRLVLAGASSVLRAINSMSGRYCCGSLSCEGGGSGCPRWSHRGGPFCTRCACTEPTHAHASDGAFNQLRPGEGMYSGRAECLPTFALADTVGSPASTCGRCLLPLSVAYYLDRSVFHHSGQHLQRCNASGRLGRLGDRFSVHAPGRWFLLELFHEFAPSDLSVHAYSEAVSRQNRVLRLYGQFANFMEASANRVKANNFPVWRDHHYRVGRLWFEKVMSTPDPFPPSTWVLR
jgi:hypothetical protein